MNRSVFSCALLLALTISMGVAAAEPRTALQLTISGTPDPRQVSYSDPKSHLLVLIQNRSGHDQRIWETSNSWGYFNLSFELTDSTGKKWVVKKRDTIFTVNLSTFLTISPGQIYIFNIDFVKEREWQAFPIRRVEGQIVQIRAIYDSTETPESKANDVWTGHLESPIINLAFVK
jgi:hypothetical protein